MSDSPVPASVRARGARADELQAQLIAARANGGEPPAQQPQPTQPGNGAPAFQPPVQAPGESDASFEQRYRTLHGRHEATVADLRALREENAALRRSQAARAAGQPAAPVQLPAAPSLVTPDEVEVFSPEFMDVVGRRAQEAVGAEIAALKAQNEALQRQIGGFAQLTFADQRAAMDRMLDEKCPKWRQLNNEDGFNDWVETPDPITGHDRSGVLKEAYAANNGQRVLAVFEGYLRETGQLNGGSSPQPTASRPSLADFAGPGRGHPGSAPVQTGTADKPIIHRSQIAAFYQAVKRGQYRGTEGEKEKARLELMIHEAEREGRISG